MSNGDQKYCKYCGDFFDLENSQAIEWHDAGNCRREIEEEKKNMKSNNIIKAEELPEGVQQLTPAEVVKVMQSEIESREIADGYKGFGVDTSSPLKRELEFYQLGLSGGIPKAWQDVLKKVDPEYDDYLRLKAKFEK